MRWFNIFKFQIRPIPTKNCDYIFTLFRAITLTNADVILPNYTPSPEYWEVHAWIMSLPIHGYQWSDNMIVLCIGSWNGSLTLSKLLVNIWSIQACFIKVSFWWYVACNPISKHIKCLNLNIAYLQIMAKTEQSLVLGIIRNPNTPGSLCMLGGSRLRYLKFLELSPRQANLSRRRGYRSIPRFSTWYITWLWYAR